jgi:predicted nucleic acid-binding protein
MPARSNGGLWPASPLRGRRPARLRTAGRAMPIKDSLIAATALTHGLVVATRNRADFAKAGVRIVDPFGV